MRPNTSVAAAALLLLASFAVRPAAQQAPPQAPPAGQAPPAPNAPPGGAQAPVPVQGGRGRGNPATFPAQQRPPGDPALIARGQTLFGVNCRICHGADLRGGDMGGVNLLRSQLVLNDQKGELILPVVHNGRQNPGMPPMPPFPRSAGRRRQGDCRVHPQRGRNDARAGQSPARVRARRTEHRRRRCRGGQGVLHREVRLLPLGHR